MQAEAEIAAVELHDVAGDEQRRAENDRHVPAQLRILPRQIEFPAQQEEIDRKIDAEQGHEDGRDRLRVGAVGGEGIVADGKAAGAGRAEGVAERVKQRLAAGQIKEDLQHRQAKIDPVEDLGRIGHPRHHLGDRRPGALGPQQVDGLAAVHPDDGQHEHQNAHAADPVRKAAPEQHAVAQRLDVGQNCRACRRKARDRLKKSIDKGRYLAGDDKRQCAENRHQHPDKRHDGQAVAGVDFRVFGGAQAGYQAQRQHDQRRPQEGKHNAPLAVDGGAAHGKEHEGCFDQEDAPQHKPYHFIVHGRALTLQCRAASAALCRW